MLEVIIDMETLFKEYGKNIDSMKIEKNHSEKKYTENINKEIDMVKLLLNYLMDLVFYLFMYSLLTHTNSLSIAADSIILNLSVEEFCGLYQAA